MAAPNCQVVGIVKDVSERTVKGKGLSEGQEFDYIDVRIENRHKRFTNEGDRQAYGQSDNAYFNCEADNGASATYQLQDASDKKFIKDNIGKCIVATSNMFADGNFRSGNWLSDLKPADPSVCE